MTRLLIVGYDGMDYFLARETMGGYPFKGVAPVLKRQVTRETLTGPSWATFYTGLDKSIHGVTDGWGRRVGGANGFRDIRRHTFFDIIAGKGLSVYTDNLPITPGGFPFTSSKEKDIVNWVYDPLEGGEETWRDGIREMDFDEVIARVRKDSFALVDPEKLGGKELVFIQFSFLDRFGHVFTFREKDLTEKSYSLAYELLEELVGVTRPKYLIVVSDHGFFRGVTTHTFANCGVAIFNEETLRFFEERDYIRKFALPRGHNRARARFLLANRSPLEILRYLYYSDFIDQTDLFEAILGMFDIEYERTGDRIEKSGEEEEYDDEERRAITKRLKMLGYI